MKECPKCKRGYGDEMHYCLTDGCYLSPVFDSEETVVRRPPPATTVASKLHLPPTTQGTPETLLPYSVKVKKGYGTGLVILLLAAGGFVVLSAIATYLGYKKQLEQSKASTTPEVQSSTPNQAPAKSTPTPRRAATTPTPLPDPPPPVSTPPLIIVEDAFAVNAGSYRYYPFTLNRPAHILGWFQASGGGNDILVGLVDEEGFTNFANRRNGKGYYWSAGYVVTDRVDVRLGPGSYYVVFDNRAALLTNKVVKASFHANF